MLPLGFFLQCVFLTFLPLVFFLSLSSDSSLIPFGTVFVLAAGFKHLPANARKNLHKRYQCFLLFYLKTVVQIGSSIVVLFAIFVTYLYLTLHRSVE